MTVVYIDSVFVINGLMDYLLLLLTAALAGRPLKRCRFALCGALGGAYGVACFLLPGLLCRWPVKLAVGGLLCLLAFGRRQYLRQMLLFYAVSAALAGLTLLLSLLGVEPTRLTARGLWLAQVDELMLLAAAVTARLLLGTVFRGGARHGGGGLLPARLRRGEREASLTLLHDTGNTLSDPLTGQGVPVVYWQAVVSLWDENDRLLFTGEALRRPDTLLERLAGRGGVAGYRLLPYRSVGVERGLLLLLRLDSIAVAGREYPNRWLALSPTPVSDGGGYDGLWNEEVRG